MLSKELEHSLIGMILYAPGNYSLVSGILSAADFADPDASRAWDCFSHMDEAGIAIDLTGVFTEARARYPRHEAIALARFCSQRAAECSSTINLRPVAHAVADCAARRRLASLGTNITQEADGNRTMQELLSDADRQLSELSLALTAEPDAPLPMEQVIDQTLRFVSEHRQQGRTITGIPTGYRRLDETTLGLQPSDLIILAARPGVGKTTLGLNMAVRIAAQGIPVGFVSIEMGRQQIALRVLSMRHLIPHSHLRAANLSEDEMARLQPAPEAAEEPMRHLFLLDSSACSVADIHRAARRLVKDHGIRCLFVDYLQLIRGAGPQRQQTREQEVAQISHGLKAMAKELNITVVALAQLNRNIERRTDAGRPQLSDLRESGSIEQDADIVCFIHKMLDDEGSGLSLQGDGRGSSTGLSLQGDGRGSSAKGTLVSLIIAKHRNGLCTDIPLLFQPDLCLFSDFPDTNELTQ